MCFGNCNRDYASTHSTFPLQPAPPGSQVIEEDEFLTIETFQLISEAVTIELGCHRFATTNKLAVSSCSPQRQQDPVPPAGGPQSSPVRVLAKEKLQPESDQVSRPSPQSAGSTKTMGNSIGLSSRFLQQINYKEEAGQPRDERYLGDMSASEMWGP